MVIAQPAIVNGPALTPAPHSLVASAQVVSESDDRWEAGFEFTPEGCASMSAWDPCDVTPADKSEPQSIDIVSHQPVLLELAVTCSAAGFQTLDFPGRARRLAEAATSKALEREFWTGTMVPTNGHLASPTATLLNGTTAVEPLCALGLLNDFLGDCGSGGRGMIHADPKTSTHFSMYLTEEGQRLVTKARRTIVVVGNGYPGTSPSGNTPATNTAWAYATGMVQVRLGPIQVIPDEIAHALDRRTNDLTYVAERTASAVWDQCCLGAVLVDLACVAI